MYMYVHVRTGTCVNLHTIIYALTCTYMSACKDDRLRGDQLKSSYLQPGSLIHTTRGRITYCSIGTPLSHYSLCVSYEHMVFS